MGGLNETIMEAEPLLSLPMGPVRTLGDNRVGWIPNCEDAAPPRCAPVCKATCCAFCPFCAVGYSNSARASGGTCSACYAFCACYLVCTCCTRCARATRFQNVTCNTVGHKSAPLARNVQMVAKGIYVPGKDNTVAHCLSRWAHPASKGMTDVSAHGAEAEIAEAKRIIEMERLMEEEGVKCFVVMAADAPLGTRMGRAVRVLAPEGAESDKHLFPESCLQDDWTDDYARSEAFEAKYRAVTDPDDGQKWPKGLSEEDGKLYRNDQLLVPESRVLELCETWHHHMMHPGVRKQAPGYAAPVRSRPDQSLQRHQEGQKGLLGLSGLQSRQPERQGGSPMDSGA